MQEYWSGLSLPSPGDLPDPGINPGSPALKADSLSFEHHAADGYGLIGYSDNQIS